MHTRRERAALSLDRTPPRRIHIVGGPGSGKTTLAQSLAAYLCVPIFSLDLIAFEGEEFTLRPLAARLADIHEIVASPGWITEGMWLGWTEELFRQADIIIWLDHVPGHVAGWRMLTRFIRGGLQEAGRQPWSRKFTRIRDFSRNIRLFACAFQSGMRFYQGSRSRGAVDGERRPVTRAETERGLWAYSARVVHCRRERDVAAVLERVRTECERHERTSSRGASHAPGSNAGSGPVSR